jgi:hypothetical protein
MLYAVQNYKVYFGLYPSSGIFGVVFCLIYTRRWIKSKINLIVL